MKKEKKYTDKELAEAYIFPSELSKDEQRKEEKDFSEFLKQRRFKMTDEDRYYSRLLQLKYMMEDYIESNSYNEEYTFSHFLREYIHSLDMKDADFSKEISLHVTKLSRLLNDKEDPNQKILVRLGIHSNESIPCLFWYRIFEKQKELEFINDKELIKEERKNVKKTALVKMQ